jgi:hypothetical protein
MSTKKVVKDASADRPTRPFPTNREPVQCNVSEARGESNPGTTKPQYQRVHELAVDKDGAGASAKAQGAIVAGRIGDRCVKAADPAADAKARFQSIHKRRKETEKVFEALRPSVAGTRKRLGR